MTNKELQEEIIKLRERIAVLEAQPRAIHHYHPYHYYPAQPVYPVQPLIVQPLPVQAPFWCNHTSGFGVSTTGTMQGNCNMTLQSNCNGLSSLTC